MLEITISAKSGWDNSNEVFVNIPKTKLRLEHSLVSVSKWESIWKTPFLTKKEFTYDETISYIKCMTLNEGVDPNIYRFIDEKILIEIFNYINDPMTATTINRPQGGSRGTVEIKTAELIYYYMIVLQIPIEFEHWHLNRLFILMEIFDVKNMPEKKMSQTQIIQDYDAINKARRAKLKSKG